MSDDRETEKAAERARTQVRVVQHEGALADDWENNYELLYTCRNCAEPHVRIVRKGVAAATLNVRDKGLRCPACGCKSDFDVRGSAEARKVQKQWRLDPMFEKVVQERDLLREELDRRAKAEGKELEAMKDALSRREGELATERARADRLQARLSEVVAECNAWRKRCEEALVDNPPPKADGLVETESEGV